MYSLTFNEDNVLGNTLSVNTWSDWQLIPDSPPMVPPPEAEKKYIDIPGRRAGPIDVTKLINDDFQYKRITGSWTFYKEINSVNDRMNVYNMLRQYFARRIKRVTLTTDDPTHFFRGWFSVSLPRAVTNPMSITISYDLEPLRYNNSNGSVDESWP